MFIPLSVPLFLALVSFRYLPMNYYFSDSFSLSICGLCFGIYLLSLSLLYLTSKCMSEMSYILMLAVCSPPTPRPSDSATMSASGLLKAPVHWLLHPEPFIPPILDFLMWDLYGFWYCALLAPQPSLTYCIAVFFAASILQAYLKCLVELSIFVHRLMIPADLFSTRYFSKLSDSDVPDLHNPTACSHSHLVLPQWH